ncbi:MAG: hypothetical protein QOK39_966 [Acidimicrobiaceae bacterium]|jgi:hypothetical protein|nr:hypothetical protein [Acidimicrobiaceae bacterium]
MTDSDGVSRRRDEGDPRRYTAIAVEGWVASEVDDANLRE